MNRSSPCLSVVMFFLLSRALVGQSIPYDHAFLPHRWDGAHSVILFGRGALRNTSAPIRSYAYDGAQHGADIRLFRDFPNLRVAVVEDLAAGANGTTVLAVVLNFGSVLKHVVLTYDASGDLLRILDTEPYFPHAVASDDDGNLFVLGERMDERKGVTAPYPLLIRYDSKGQVVGKLLYSSVFQNGSDAIEQSEQHNAQASVMLRDGNLFLYLPGGNEVLICSLDGTIVRRARLGDVLLDIQHADRIRRASIQNVSFVDDTHVVLDLVEYAGPDEPGTTRVMDTTTTHTAVYLFDLVTKKNKLVLRGETGTNGMFLGTKGNQVLTLGPGTGQGASIDSHSIF